MERPSTSLDSLPNEILIQILNTFSVRSLLPIAAVNHHFYDLVGRLHYSRLVEACRLEDHEFILECYHPSVKISTPTLFCQYLGTDGLPETSHNVKLGHLGSLYTRFRPYLSDRSRPRPKGAVLDVNDGPNATKPDHDVFLDSGELFTQLCTSASLVMVEPKRGLFRSIANVTDGVIRVWRDWLKREAARSMADVEGTAETAQQRSSSVLWTDTTENVGLRFRVVENEDLRAPVLIGPDDEPPISYRLEFEELFVRTNQLLLSYEKSLDERAPHPVPLQDLLLSAHAGKPQYYQPSPLLSQQPDESRWSRLFGEHGKVSVPVRFAAQLSWCLATDAAEDIFDGIGKELDAFGKMAALPFAALYMLVGSLDSTHW